MSWKKLDSLLCVSSHLQAIRSSRWWLANYITESFWPPVNVPHSLPVWDTSSPVCNRCSRVVKAMVEATTFATTFLLTPSLKRDCLNTDVLLDTGKYLDMSFDIIFFGKVVFFRIGWADLRTHITNKLMNKSSYFPLHSDLCSAAVFSVDVVATYIHLHDAHQCQIR